MKFPWEKPESGTFIKGAWGQLARYLGREGLANFDISLYYQKMRHRTAVLINCSRKEARKIREIAARQRRTISG